MSRQETKSIQITVKNGCQIRSEDGAMYNNYDGFSYIELLGFTFQLDFHACDPYYIGTSDDVGIRIGELNDDGLIESMPEHEEGVCHIEREKERLKNAHVQCELYPICVDDEQERIEERQRAATTPGENVHTATYYRDSSLIIDMIDKHHNGTIHDAPLTTISKSMIMCEENGYLHVHLNNGGVKGSYYNVCLTVTINLDGPVEPESTYLLK